jgi:SRSO17 transposase
MELENPEAWSEAFETFFTPFSSHFLRSETRNSVQLYIRGLLADVRRKNSWQLAEAVGLPDPHSLQRVLNEALWDADAVGETLRRVIIEQIGYEPGIGVIDESGFAKSGHKSVGVARQYCGRLGKVDNCQVGVYLGYVSSTGAAFLDRELYLTKGWCEDQDRRRAAKIPDTVTFQTKPQLAQTMLERAWQEEIPLQWVVADTLYGNSPTLREAIQAKNRYYVMAIGGHHRIIRSGETQPVALSTLVQSLPDPVWEQMCFRIGEKGLIWHEWTAVRVTMPKDALGEQWLLIQRTLDHEPVYTFYLSNAPEETTLVALATVAVSRHPIEELLEEAKGEVGMADYEVRHWHGWYRHMTLVMLAHTWLKLLQHQQREKKSAARLVELQSG